jgi:uncharacterized protein
VQPAGPQRAREPDEWQPDEGGGIAAVDRLQQRHPETLRLETAGAVERALACHVALDLLRTQRAERAGRQIDMGLFLAACLAHQRAGGMELRRATAEYRELLAAVRGIAGFIEQAAGSGGDLVAADDQSIGVLPGYDARFFQRQPQRAVAGGFARPVGLVHTRGLDFKRQPEPLQKFAAVDRRGSEDKAWHGPWRAMRIAFEKQELTPKSAFDLGTPHTYYTRPMSPPWSQPLDIDRLADGGADLDFAVPLAELSGVRSLRTGVTGEVRAHAHFGRAQGLTVAELRLDGEALLECQRCMRPLQLPLHVSSRIALIGAEADAARVPEDLEPVLARGGRISMDELITEELLLSLPIVPLHEGAASCAAQAAPAASAQAGETHRPFARLDELMKR